jgi:hypothetical protein
VAIGLYIALENVRNPGQDLSGPDQAQHTPAPTHCPVCLSKILTRRTRRLVDDFVRRYRVCPNGCYEDRTITIVEKSSLHETD